MKKNIFPHIGFLLFLYSGLAGPIGNESPASQANTVEDWRRLVYGLDRVLIALAAERSAQYAQSNQVYILGVHDGYGQRKYTDGHYVVVLLPANEDVWLRSALCFYAENFNYLQVKRADHRLESGEFKQVAQFYRLILHFDPCHSTWTDSLRDRLPLIEELANGKDVKANSRKLREVFLNSGSLTPALDFGAVEAASPTVVTNLLSVRLPKAPTRQSQ